MPVKADIGFGTVVMVGATMAANTVTVTVGALRSLDLPSWARGSVDVTTFDSPDSHREFIPELADAGELSFGLLWKPNNTTDQLLETLKAELEPRLWRVSFPQVATPAPFYSFRAFLTGKSTPTPMDDAITCDVTLKLSGRVTVGTVA